MSFDEKEISRRYNSYYLSVIMRYKEHIEQSESIYLPDMPKLIEPYSEEILAFASAIKNEFENYNQKEDFHKAAERAFKKLEEEILVVQLPIQFWQTPSETLVNGICDILDYSSTLCSIFIALGCVSSKVVVINSDDSNKIMVYCENNNTFYLFEHMYEIKLFKDKELLLKYIIEKTAADATAYEFNDKLYRDLILPLSSS